MRTLFVIVTVAILALFAFLWPKNSKRSVEDYEQRLLCRVTAESALEEARSLFGLMVTSQKVNSFTVGLLPPYPQSAVNEYLLPVDNTVSLFGERGLAIAESSVRVKRLDACDYQGRGQGLVEFMVEVRGFGKRLLLIEAVRFSNVENRRRGRDGKASLVLRYGALWRSFSWIEDKHYGASAVDGIVLFEKHLRPDIARLYADEGAPSSLYTPNKMLNYDENNRLTLTIAVPNTNGMTKCVQVTYTVEKVKIPSGESALALYRKEGNSSKKLIQGVLLKKLKYMKHATRRRMDRIDYLVVDVQTVGADEEVFSTNLFIPLPNCPWGDHMKSYTLD